MYYNEQDDFVIYYTQASREMQEEYIKENFSRLLYRDNVLCGHKTVFEKHGITGLGWRKTGSGFTVTTEDVFNPLILVESVPEMVDTPALGYHTRELNIQDGEYSLAPAYEFDFTRNMEQEDQEQRISEMCEWHQKVGELEKAKILKLRTMFTMDEDTKDWVDRQLEEFRWYTNEQEKEVLGELRSIIALSEKEMGYLWESETYQRRIREFLSNADPVIVYNTK